MKTITGEAVNRIIATQGSDPIVKEYLGYEQSIERIEAELARLLEQAADAKNRIGMGYETDDYTLCNAEENRDNECVVEVGDWVDRNSHGDRFCIYCGWIVPGSN